MSGYGDIRSHPFPVAHEYMRGQPVNAPRTITWEIAEEAYREYVRRYGRCQTLERIAERGGFYPSELRDLLGREWPEPPTTEEP